MPQLRLVRRTSAEAVKWPELGYADASGESFERFRALQEDGTIPEGVAFRCNTPHPLAPIAGTIAPADQPPGTTADQVRLIDAYLTESPSRGRQWGSAPDAEWAASRPATCRRCSICTARFSIPTRASYLEATDQKPSSAAAGTR